MPTPPRLHQISGSPQHRYPPMQLIVRWGWMKSG